MSAQPVRTAPARPAPSSWRPRLQVVRAPANQRSLLPFAALCLTILVGAMLGALMLNTAMAATAYELREQRIDLARLSEHQQVLAHQAEQIAAPWPMRPSNWAWSPERGPVTSSWRTV